MLNLKNKKRIKFILTIFLIILFIYGIPSLLPAVSSEECMDAYNECMDQYWWSGPFGYAYCTNGLMFCLLYL